MERILLYQNDNQWIDKLPEESGVLSFYSDQELIYLTNTANLRRMAVNLWAQKDDELVIGELFSKAKSLEVEETGTSLDALIKTKVTLEQAKPEFNPVINNWKNYVYLAINPAEFPFAKIVEYTEEDWFYIGPFRSRFILTDVMELMFKLLKLPYCEVKQGPCEKLDNQNCRGWCMLIKTETQDNEEEKPDKPHLQKLDALLKEAFVHADNGLLEMILKEKQKYEDDLQFAKSDLLRTTVELLKRYKDWLIFLYKIKSLSFMTDKIRVKNGQITHFKYAGKEHQCPFVEIPYRPNEVLALNKNLVDEAWIVYQESLNV